MEIFDFPEERRWQAALWEVNYYNNLDQEGSTFKNEARIKKGGVDWLVDDLINK
jgi:hypothetical protein